MSNLYGFRLAQLSGLLRDMANAPDEGKAQVMTDDELIEAADALLAMAKGEAR